VPGPTARCALLAAWLLPAPGCGYVADRGLDFLDQYRIAAGVGPTAGVRWSSVGLVDTGLMFGLKPRDTAIGWRYGVPAAPALGGGLVDVDQAQLLVATSIVGLDYDAGRYASARHRVAVLPALFCWVDASPDAISWQVPEDGDSYDDEVWLWSASAFDAVRYQQVHAFDAEFDLALFGYLDLGYSPGELLDFLLGFVGIDLAADDGRL
jgi:hypothetical protein